MRRLVGYNLPCTSREAWVLGRGEPDTLIQTVGATSTLLKGINGLAFDSQGTLYVSEEVTALVWRLDAATGMLQPFAGDGTRIHSGDGGPALEAGLDSPHGLLFDAEGNLYVTEYRRLRRIDAQTGVITTIVGNDECDYCGEGGNEGPAIDASLCSPAALAWDLDGNLLVAEQGNSTVRRIDMTANTIHAFAGILCGEDFSGDGGPAVDAALYEPQYLAIGANGDVYFSDDSAQVVRRVSWATRYIDTVAGTPNLYSFTGDDGAAVSATLRSPAGLLFDDSGNLLLADRNNERIRMIDTADVITTLYGDGTTDHYGDGGLASEAHFYNPRLLAWDPNGALVISYSYSLGSRVRRIATDGTVTTILGGPVDASGDGTTEAAFLDEPSALVVASDGSVLVADGKAGRVRRFDGTRLSSVVGYGDYEVDDESPSTSARYSSLLNDPAGLVLIESEAALLVSVRGNHTICRVDFEAGVSDPASWEMVACIGTPDVAGSIDGPTSGAQFNQPAGMAATDDPEWGEIVFVADSGNHVIRRLDLETQQVSTVAGVAGIRGFFGEGSTADEAIFDTPTDVTMGPNRSLFVADTGNHRVRRIDLNSGLIWTVVGDGRAATSGSGSPAQAFTIDSPMGVASDVFGNVLLTSRTAVRLLSAGADHLIDGSGFIATVYGERNDLFPASETRCLSGIVMDPTSETGSVAYVVDSCRGFLLRLARENL